ncbi:MAG TPA: DUF1611 domain-containing protein [Steroidobacter sp.]|uniref:DUF1611 domain-containing protein n=1 Tax=Steroidobacter sp. TaxID=1978227 RepID=UPI002ED7822E
MGLPWLNPAAAASRGAKSLVLAVAPIGGVLPDAWKPTLFDALDAGLDLVNGLHDRLVDVPELREAAQRLGRNLLDIRRPSGRFSVATGVKRKGKRLLTVGTDCALGKKYTALALTAALRARGVPAEFRATGQTGILIAGGGVPIDAVVADFIAGAAESLSPENDPDHWDVVEGQGSLFHPAYAAVTLGLIHGSQPDALVLCHDPTRLTLNGYPHFRTPDLREAIARYLDAAHLTNPAAQFVAISLNTSHLSEQHTASLLAELEQEFGLPCFDPMKQGIERAVERIVAL